MTLALKMADTRYDSYGEGFEKGREEDISIGLEQKGASPKALKTTKISRFADTKS